MGNTQIADMVLTQAQKDTITKEAIEKAELEEMGISIMIPFMKYANKALFANAHYIKKADKKEGIVTDQTQLNLPLFIRLGNKALAELNLPHTLTSAWNGMISFETYDPSRRDIT